MYVYQKTKKMYIKQNLDQNVHVFISKDISYSNNNV